MFQKLDRFFAHRHWKTIGGIVRVSVMTYLTVYVLLLTAVALEDLMPLLVEYVETKAAEMPTHRLGKVGAFIVTNGLGLALALGAGIFAWKVTDALGRRPLKEDDSR